MTGKITSMAIYNPWLIVVRVRGKKKMNISSFIFIRI